MIDFELFGGFGNGQTDRLTDKRTLVVVESLLRLKNLGNKVPQYYLISPPLCQGLALETSLFFKPWMGSRAASDPMLVICFSSNFLRIKSVH